jgi:hypothetical protein
VAGRPTAAAALALALGLAAAAIAPRRAAADEEDVPRGEIGMAIAFRRNLGELERQYGLGYLWGFVAGYQVTRPDEPFGLGFVWSALFGRSQLWETLGDDDPAIASGPLRYV